MNKKVLVIAAHPDDEVLGCGGTIIKHVEDNDEVHIMILAEGITSRDITRNTLLRSEELKKLHEDTSSCAKIMGVKDIELYDFPDNRMDSVPLLDIVKKIEIKIEKFQPHIVYTHHNGDVNIDHTIAHIAAVTACRSLPGQCVKRILFFETLSSTEWQMQTSSKIFKPNWYVEIAKTFEKKINALKCYSSEMRKYPHPRSYEGVKILAQYRALAIGGEYAEAFSLGRNIE